jgi:hypothetical protein
MIRRSPASSGDSPSPKDEEANQEKRALKMDEM